MFTKPAVLKVGLTGGIGSGKSAVAERLQTYGVQIIDADRIAHQLTAAGGHAIAQLIAQFGPDILQADGALDRAKMRAHVFNYPHARKDLETILHPLIRQQMRAAAEQPDATAPYQIYAIPLLVESAAENPDWLNFLDQVIVIDCQPDLQIQRVQQRSGLSENTIKQIIAAQASREQRLTLANFVLHNEHDLSKLWQQVDSLHQSLLQLATKKRVD